MKPWIITQLFGFFDDIIVYCTTSLTCCLGPKGRGILMESPVEKVVSQYYYHQMMVYSRHTYFLLYFESNEFQPRWTCKNENEVFAKDTEVCNQRHNSTRPQISLL